MFAGTGIQLTLLEKVFKIILCNGKRNHTYQRQISDTMVKFFLALWRGRDIILDLNGSPARVVQNTRT